ncbi:hypothetical protein [Clostridium sp. MD294]|uniref:hypothetical protein n=1 Tax=Clostridium sp. MD294 TaxID=97138 RepID=UPI0002CBB9DA|nr:hypothetical protein [Clostridium sp. MD294]NDO45305.1 hypothetical protein [Clostridium sp. MD294]USF31058.1 hypothetical protein C820_002504 [Clostridium sp. MD294]
MVKLKKFVSLLCTMVLLCSVFSFHTFAATEEIIETTENEGVNTLQPLEEVALHKVDSEEFEIVNLEDNVNVETFEEEIDTSSINLMSRDAWRITQPIYVGNGTLDESVDFYIVNVSKTSFPFLKLNSDNDNLMAAFYKLDPDGTIGKNAKWGVFANKGYTFWDLNRKGEDALETGQYVIAIGSSTGNERGDYTLMWNCSNEISVNGESPKTLIDVTSDLSRIILFYDLNTIICNGTNILNKLVWEEHETWYGTYGYSARDMKITAMKGDNGEPAARGVYVGSFSSSAPYSTSKALLVDVNHGVWTYANSYYQNIGGDVKHIIDYFDVSGQKTPRTFGEGPVDFDYGRNYIVIDLNTFEVCEFLSPFNYHYTQNGGRTFTLSNLQQAG